MKSTLVPILALLVLTIPVSGTVLNVPTPYTHIQDAVDAASSGDTVLVAAGTYNNVHYPPVLDTTQCVVFMKSGVTLLGNGIGSSIIDALGNGRGIHCDGVAGGRIEGFTIRNAFAQIYGAGIFCDEGSSPTIVDCEITECMDGGLIIKDGSDPIIAGCVITDNHNKQGGGVAVEDTCTADFTGCEILRNSAPSGGGVFIRAGCEVTIENCVIDSNFLSTQSGSAGGIAVLNATLTVRNCRVNANTAGKGGGFSIGDNSTVVIESTYIQNNLAEGDYGPGGGVYIEMSNLDMDDCTISGNQCPGEDSNGGGIFGFVVFGTFTITGCTIVDNGTYADSLGGGIACDMANPVIENTIIAYNSPGMGLSCVGGSGNPTLSCTDIYGNSGGDDICGTDNGGNFSWPPYLCDASAENFTLSSSCNSPCLPGNHPNGNPCGLIGAHGAGVCDLSDVADGAEEEDFFTPGSWHFASPNPFGTATTIHFGIQRAGHVNLEIYSLSGRRVRAVQGNFSGSGAHQIIWDSRDDRGKMVPSGVYFYRLSGSNLPRQSGRLVLTR